jgi:hypothetical protein
VKRPKISIAEQMYAAGIWERPMIEGRVKFKGLRITSDGTGWGSHVIDGETGKDIPGITRAEWSCSDGDLARVTLYGHKVALDIMTGEIQDKAQVTIFPEPGER